MFTYFLAESCRSQRPKMWGWIVLPRLLAFFCLFAYSSSINVSSQFLFLGFLRFFTISLKVLKMIIYTHTFPLPTHIHILYLTFQLVLVFIIFLGTIYLNPMTVDMLTVRYHCGGWPEEVNTCFLNSYMVYL